MARLVVDASVLLVLADEAHEQGATGPVSHEILEWHNVYDVVAPALLAYEVANVVHHKWTRRRPGGDAELRRALVLDMLAFVRLVAADRLATSRIGAIAESLGLTAYDAAYVELAERDEDSVLVTEDAALRQKAALVLGKERVLGLAQR